MKRQNGITLVALVITIIILLILAGISIATLSNTGIFGKAQEARTESEAARLNELNTLNDYETAINAELDKLK